MMLPHALATARPFGDQLRRWRKLRRMSQLDFALEAEISQKHLSFIESGRAKPSREMVTRLARRLEVPLRETNLLLLAAGYAPAFPERKLDDPAMAAARQAVDLVLKGHEPYPALALDRRWNLVAANAAARRLLGLVTAPRLLSPPINLLRLSLDPEGLQPHVVDFGSWREHLLHRLKRQADLSGDVALAALHAELALLPAPAGDPASSTRADEIVLQFKLRTPVGLLSFISTTTIFGSPVDVTLSELALEAFYPADAATAEVLQAMAC